MKTKHAWFVGASLVIALVVLTGIAYVGPADAVEGLEQVEVATDVASVDVLLPEPLGVDCRPCAIQCGGWDNILQCTPSCICKLN